VNERRLSIGRALASASCLLVVIVGVPVALATSVGWPLPRSLPDADAVIERLDRSGIDAQVVIKVLAVVIWLAWLQIVVAVAVETIAIVRGHTARRVAVVLPGVQGSVARLVAALGLFVAPAVHGRGVVSGPALVAHEVAAAPVHVEPTTPAPESPPRPVEGTSRYVVQRHDTLWDIASRLLGDGLRWRDIAALNAGMTMNDGSPFPAAGDPIRPGWTLLVPQGASTLPPDAEREVLVGPGDHLWGIAERELVTAGVPADDDAVRQYWVDVIDTNRSRLADPANPNLLFAGQVVVLPPVDDSGVPPPAPVVPGGEVVDPSPDSAVEPPEPGPFDVPPAAPDTDTEPGERPPTASDESAVEDSDDDGVAPGLLGVTGVLSGVGIAAALRSRRRRVRLNDSSTLPAPVPTELADAARDILLAADVDDVSVLVAALEAVIAARATPDPRPRIVRITTDEVEVLLHEPAPAVPPWCEQGGGAIWSAHRELLPAPSSDTTAPLVVALGRTTSDEDLYLDLEGEGCVSVIGGDAALDVVRSFVHDVAYSPLASGATVLVVGDLGLPGDMARVRQVRCWEAAATEVHAWSACAQPDAPGRARLDEGAGAVPALLLVVTEPPADASFADACSRARATRSGLAVVVVNGAAGDATTVLVNDDELAIVDLRLTCRPQRVADGAAETVAALVQSAGETSDPHLVVLPTLPGEEQTTLFDDPHEASVEVRFLGEIDVQGADKPLTPKQVAVLSYLALHGPMPADRLETALWPTATSSRRKRLANALSECRAALGSDRLPPAFDGRYRLGPGVVTDLRRFDALLGEAKSGRSPAETAATLRRALELVRGPVFSYRAADRESYVWVDLEHWTAAWEVKVTDTALHLATLLLDADDIDGAVWAAERGLLAVPSHTELTEALMRAYWRRGDRPAAQQVYESHVAALETLDLDEVAETTSELWERIRTTS
jgi:DNA-binding SARP family transcriptional activator